MSLSHRDRKILWARSGNRCAFTHCGQILVVGPSSSGRDVIVGEEAHIVARESDGPRGRAPTEHDVASHLNHILLCPTHHRLIDDDPDAYSVEALHLMKRAHEDAVRAAVYGDATIELPPSRFQGLGFGEPFLAWQFLKATLVVFSCGSPPLRTAEGHLVGSGFHFVEVDPTMSRRGLFFASEGQPDIEFWLDRAVVHVIQYTFDPDREGFAALAEHTFDGSVSPIRHSLSLLLSSDGGVGATLESVAAELEALPGGSGQRAEVLLYRLRNLGVHRPADALAILAKLKRQPWYDGSTAESGSDVERDLRLVHAFAPAV